MTDPKRPPPTIDLEPNPPADESAWQRLVRSFRTRFSRPSWPPRPSSRVPLLAALSGALAALVLVAILWSAGLMTQRTTILAPAPTDDLGPRVARIEARLATPPAPDAALTARVAAVEQSVEAIRRSSQQMQQAIERQGDALKSSLDELKAASRAAAPAVDLAPLNQRLAELEQSIRGLTAQRAEPEAINPALARVMVANQLAAAVRSGEPFGPALAAAKQDENAALLAPLEAFASGGVPDDAALARELVALLPQLEPKPEPQTQPRGTSSTWIERLEASASKLVRVRPVGERDPSSAVARIATAARSNDVAAARRELEGLPQPQRAPAQAWIARTDARESARKASLDFAAKALAALPRQ